MKIFRSLGLVIVLIVTFAGTWTTNQFIYKPDAVGQGQSEKHDFDSGLNRVDARLAYEVWLGDPGGSPGYDTLANAITTIGSKQVILRLPAGTVSITTDTTIPANMTLAPARGAILSIATTKTLTINGGLDAGLYQIFSPSGTGRVVFGPGAVAALYPQWWGAKGDGVTDDGAAISAACSAVANAGVKTLKFLNGNYRIYSVGTSYTNLGTFTGITGLGLISQGATFSIDPNRTFSNQYGFMFLLYDCHNVLIDGFNVVGPTLSEIQIQNKNSVEFVRALQHCTNINMPYNKLSGVNAGFITYVDLAGGETATNRCSNINIGLMEVSNSLYGVSCGHSGDNLFVGMLKCDGVGRAYSGFGFKNHKVNVTAKNSVLTGVSFYGWQGGGCEDVDLTYVDTETTACGTQSWRTEIIWNDTTPAIFRNIHIKFNQTFKPLGAGVTATSLGLMRIKKTTNGSIPDVVDRGHKLDNLRIEGYIEGIPSGTPALITTDAGCLWGASGTPDVWDNITMGPLKIVGAGISSVNTGAINGYLTFDHVISQNSPWQVRKNYNVPNPAGKIKVIASDIKNLYVKTDTYFDPIIVLKLSDYAVAHAYTLSPKESGKIVSSAGVTETTTVNLPAAVPGLEYIFERVGKGALRIQPLGGDYIVGGGSGKYVSLDSLGTTICLRCGTDGLWQIQSAVGTYAFQP